MKSVMQEASSLSKAFEQAWEKAGKPTQCTVKILEEPKHNFLGMTLQSAKIALFFDEISQVKPAQQPQQARRQQPVKKAQPNTPVKASDTPVPSKPVQSVEKKSASQPKAQEAQKPAEQRPDYWSEEMISAARLWFKDVLKTMERSDISFDVNINRFYLRFSVDKPVYEDEQRERDLFRNLSFLLLQTLRNKFNRPLKGYKVVLARSE